MIKGDFDSEIQTAEYHYNSQLTVMNFTLMQTHIGDMDQSFKENKNGFSLLKIMIWIPFLLQFVQ